MALSIANNRMAKTFGRASVPIAPHSAIVLQGCGTTVSGRALAGNALASGTDIAITNYDNTYPAVNGEALVLNGTYEIA